MGEPMNAYALSLEISAIQARTRKVTIVSLGIHALLFLLLALRHTIVPPAPALTEISWIEPVTIPLPAPTATRPTAHAVTRTPRPGAVSISQEPPADSSRRRMLVIPLPAGAWAAAFG